MDKFNSDGVKIISVIGGGGGGLTNINISAGTTSQNLSNIVFSNSNGLSFGLNGSTITAVQSAIRGLGVSNVGNTAGNTGLSTGIDWVIAGTNNITASQSTTPGGPNTVWISGGAGGGGITAINVSAGTTSNNLTNIVFSNSNNVSFGLDGSTITATVTVATSLTNIRVSAGTTSNLLSAITFSNSNGVSFGLDASTITASIATSLTNIRVSAGTTSNLLSAITFSNSNGISFGIDASTITASVAAQTNQTLGLYAVGDTTGESSSSTFDARTVSFRGTGGNVSLGFSNGSVLVSVTAGGGGEADKTINLWQNLDPLDNAFPVTTNLTASSRTLWIFPLVWKSFLFPGVMTINTARMLVSISASTASITGQHSVGVSLGLYKVSASNSASTLSLVNSASSTWTHTTLSSSAFSNSYFGQRWLEFHSSQWSAQPALNTSDTYVMGLIYSWSSISFNTFATFGGTMGQGGNSHISGTAGQAIGTASSRGFNAWHGIYSTTTTAFPTSVHASEIYKSQLALRWVPFLEFDNLLSVH